MLSKTNKQKPCIKRQLVAKFGTGLEAAAQATTVEFYKTHQ